MIRPERHDLVRGLIYPVPDPEFPFLGVHFTRTVHGDVEAGPNAVLAFAREGYRFGRIHLRELAGTLGYRGFWAMARRYWRMGSYEMYRSLSKAAFVQALQRLLPDIGPADITPGGAGVRAQAVAEDGSLVDDFRIARSDGRDPRPERAVAGRHGVARHRPPHRRARHGRRSRSPDRSGAPRSAGRRDLGREEPGHLRDRSPPGPPDPSRRSPRSRRRAGCGSSPRAGSARASSGASKLWWAPDTP